MNTMIGDVCLVVLFLLLIILVMYNVHFCIIYVICIPCSVYKATNVAVTRTLNKFFKSKCKTLFDVKKSCVSVQGITLYSTKKLSQKTKEQNKRFGHTHHIITFLIAVSNP